MKRDLMDILVCPMTKQPLELHVDEERDGEIITGYLYSKAIDFKYPIEDGIPNLLPPEMQREMAKEKWSAVRGPSDETQPATA